MWEELISPFVAFQKSAILPALKIGYFVPLPRKVLQVSFRNSYNFENWDIINFPQFQCKKTNFLSFKVASYSAGYLTNSD